MRRSSEELTVIPGEQRVRFCLALGAIVIALAQQPQRQARAQIDRTQPRTALGGVFQYALLQPRDVWSGLDSRSHLAHFVVSLALCAAVGVERIASSSRSTHLLPH